MARPKKVVEVAQVDEPTVVVVQAPDDTTEAMNSLALRIWEGQSIDLPINERTRRVVAGLNAQGYIDTSKLSLPKA